MIRLYFKLLEACLRSRMQYRLDFLASAVSYGCIMAIDFLLLTVILYRFDDVKGWNLYEVGILYGISSAAMSLYRLLAPEIHEFERYMVQGEFDSLLIRPVSPLLLLLTKNLDLGRVGGVVQGIAIIVFSVAGLSETAGVPIGLLLYIPVAIAGGAVISLALGLGTATVGFWTQQIRELQVFTIYAPLNAANYPMSLYPDWLKTLFYTALPVAFINYVPVVYLLGKGGSTANLLMAPAFAIVSLLLALKFWKLGMRHYHSTGS